jgi:hypothetical protein
MDRTKRSPRALARRGALARARRRQRSAGAVMFIVVITLGLLAAMGVYGMSSASSDIKAAGHMRDALQGQKAGEHGLTMVAETLNPGTAQTLVTNMTDEVNRTKNCRTAATYLGGGTAPSAAGCLRLSETEMTNAVAFVNPLIAPGFAPDSFGALNTRPYVEVELSIPLDMPPPPGSGYDPNTTKFTQVTATVFVNVRTAPTAAAQAVVAGRGRLTVGPIQGRPPRY